MRIPLALATLALLLSPANTPAQPAGDGTWTPIFNGKDLDGWTPKFVGQELGTNFNETFRVENGAIRVAYDKYANFDKRFGHLFYKERLSDYRLKIEYRFVGDQCPGGPGWAFRNSGVMLHCQDPKTMRKDQDFPVSIEAQFLGGRGTGERSTANVCSPDTNYVHEGKLVTAHCKNSTSKTFHGDQWVTVEIEVRGNRSIKHFVNGELVFDYANPQLDETDADAKRMLADGAPKQIDGGWISLQAESHPVEFRKVELMRFNAPQGR